MEFLWIWGNVLKLREEVLSWLFFPLTTKAKCKLPAQNKVRILILPLCLELKDTDKKREKNIDITMRCNLVLLLLFFFNCTDWTNANELRRRKKRWDKDVSVLPPPMPCNNCPVEILLRQFFTPTVKRLLADSYLFSNNNKKKDRTALSILPMNKH